MIIKGSIACRDKTVNDSAKYDVSIQAEDCGTLEGLARMLDVLNTASTPVTITSDVKNKHAISGGDDSEMAIRSE